MAWTTAGVGSYHALMVSARKAYRHGLSFLASYTWSHSLDESSGYGFFYNHKDPRTLRSAYASSDFGRTHVTTVSYDYFTPKTMRGNHVLRAAANGRGMSGIITFETGQPYNVYDYSGTVGGLFFSSNAYLTNPCSAVGKESNTEAGIGGTQRSLSAECRIQSQGAQDSSSSHISFCWRGAQWLMYIRPSLTGV